MVEKEKDERIGSKDETQVFEITSETQTGALRRRAVRSAKRQGSIPHSSTKRRFRYMEPFSQFTTSYQWADRLLVVIPIY